MTTRDSILGRAIASALATTCRASVDGFSQTRGQGDAIAAEIDYHGRAIGRFVLALPRTLLPALFGSMVPGVGSAEAELATALGELARAACTQALRAQHDTAYGFILESPRTGGAAAAEPGEIVVRVGGSWLAVNLFEV